MGERGRYSLSPGGRAGVFALKVIIWHPQAQEKRRFGGVELAAREPFVRRDRIGRTEISIRSEVARLLEGFMFMVPLAPLLGLNRGLLHVTVPEHDSCTSYASVFKMTKVKINRKFVTTLHLLTEPTEQDMVTVHTAAIAILQQHSNSARRRWVSMPWSVLQRNSRGSSFAHLRHRYADWSPTPLMECQSPLRLHGHDRAISLVSNSQVAFFVLYRFAVFEL